MMINCKEDCNTLKFQTRLKTFGGKNALAYSFDKDKICLKQVFEDLFANLFKKETSAELTFAGSQHWCDALLST